MLGPLVCLLALAGLGLAERKYFLQFTDLHMEKNYRPGSSTSKRCVDGEGDTPSIAYIGCDMGPDSIRKYLEKVKEKYPNPTFIMYNGDSNPHYVDVGYANPYDRDDVLEYAEEGMKIIHDVWPDIPFIPILGNHDNYPSDQLAVNEEGLAHLKTIGEMFSAYIPQDEVDTFTSKGYYVHDISDDIRIIVMTSVLCDLVNFYATFTGGENDMGMFAAVRAALEQARADGKHVLFALHRPAGKHETTTTFADFLPVCRNKLNAIYNDFADIMTYGSFTGHTHKNSFRIFVDEDKKPIHVQFVCIGLTSYHEQQPGNNLYYYDEDKHVITDAIEMYMNVDASNKANEVVLEEFPSLAETYNIPDLSAASMFEIYKGNCQSKDSDQFKDYYARVFSNNPNAARITNKVWAEIACGSGSVDPETYEACVENLKAGKPFSP